MTFLFCFVITTVRGFPLMFFGEGGVSFGLYDISKSLTPLGWAVIIIVPPAVIFGIIYLAAKILKKPKLK